MIDLHTHILPGVDDGVRTEDEAVEFARVAWDGGTRTIVATPHCKEGFYVNDRDGVAAAVAVLRERLRREGLTLELIPGAEVHLCPGLLERIADGRAPTLGDNGKTLLLELSLSQPPPELDNLIFSLRLAGIVTIFAHPERIRYFQDDIERYAELVRLGAYGQVTTGSLLGVFGSTSQRVAETMVRRGLIHVLASDAHNVRGRPPQLEPALQAMSALVGESLARQMVTELPQALLAGAEVELPEMAAPPRHRSFFSRWLGRGD